MNQMKRREGKHIPDMDRVCAFCLLMEGDGGAKMLRMEKDLLKPVSG